MGYSFQLAARELLYVEHWLECEIAEWKGNIVFNDTLNTFYLQLYSVGHMVKDHSDSERKPAAAT